MPLEIYPAAGESLNSLAKANQYLNGDPSVHVIASSEIFVALNHEQGFTSVGFGVF